MTSIENYYNNPFAEDLDDACYADPEAEEALETPPAALQMPHQSRHSLDSRGTSPGVTAPSRLESNSASGRPTSAQLSLQQQLQEAQASNQAMSEEYESFLESLRQELEAAQVENNGLLSKQAALESRLRQTVLEKEDAEWKAKEEAERNRVLTEKVEALEAQLGGRFDQPSVNQNMYNNRTPSISPAMNQQPSSQPQPQQPIQPQASFRPQDQWGGPGATSTPPPQQQQPRRQLPMNRQQVQQEQQRSAAAYMDANTTNPGSFQPRQNQQRQPSVQELESMLLYHTQTRDELQGELQRLEGARAKTGAELRRRVQMATQLEEEEKQIGHVRLLIRQQAPPTKRKFNN